MYLVPGDSSPAASVPASVPSGTMVPTSAAHDLEDTEGSPSPFRAAFGRARVEAHSAVGPSREPPGIEATPGRFEFEYRLVRRRGKRSADEADWNSLGRQGWELVGVTGKHAAFKRPLSRHRISRGRSAGPHDRRSRENRTISSPASA